MHAVLHARHREVLGASERVVVVDEPGRALEVDAELHDVLVELGGDDLGDAHLRTGVAGLAVLAGPHVGEASDLGLHPQAHQLVLVGVAATVIGQVLPDLHRSRDRTRATLGRAAAGAGTDRVALVHQGGERRPPALALGADAVGVGHSDVGHVDLVELGLAGDLAQRPHLDALALHVEREVGHALVLGRVGVGAGDEHAVVGEVGQGVPHLLAIHDPLVAVTDRTGAEAGEVGAGARLAEELAPLLLAGEHRAEEALLLGVVAVGDDRRAGEEHEELRRSERLGARRPQALLDRLLQLGPKAHSAEAFGEVDPRQAGVVLVASELLVALDLGVVIGEELVDRVVDALRVGRGFGHG